MKLSGIKDCKMKNASESFHAYVLRMNKYIDHATWNGFRVHDGKVCRNVTGKKEPYDLWEPFMTLEEYGKRFVKY